MAPLRPAAALALLLVVAALAAPALAQVPTLPGGTPADPVQSPLRLAPGRDVEGVRPQGGYGVTNLSVQLHCSALHPQDPTTVELVVETSPGWATVALLPTPVVFGPSTGPVSPPNPPDAPCVNEFRVQEVAVLVSAGVDAPAYQPGQIVLLATVGEKSARAFLNASAAAFVDMAAGASETAGRASPTVPWAFEVLITNRGNHRVLVDLVGGARAGIEVQVSGGAIGSRQAGDASNEQSFSVRVTPAATVVNGNYPVWINATATVPNQPGVRADRESILLQVQVEGAALPPEEEKRTLGAAAVGVAPLALALAAALLAAAPRRRA